MQVITAPPIEDGKEPFKVFSSRYPLLTPGFGEVKLIVSKVAEPGGTHKMNILITCPSTPLIGAGNCPTDVLGLSINMLPKEASIVTLPSVNVTGAAKILPFVTVVALPNRAPTKEVEETLEIPAKVAAVPPRLIAVDPIVTVLPEVRTYAGIDKNVF